MGDVLWYLATLSREFGFTLEDIAKKTLKNSLRAESAEFYMAREIIGNEKRN